MISPLEDTYTWGTIWSKKFMLKFLILYSQNSCKHSTGSWNLTYNDILDETTAPQPYFNKGIEKPSSKLKGENKEYKENAHKDRSEQDKENTICFCIIFDHDLMQL